MKYNKKNKYKKKNRNPGILYDPENKLLSAFLNNFTISSLSCTIHTKLTINVLNFIKYNSFCPDFLSLLNFN